MTENIIFNHYSVATPYKYFHKRSVAQKVIYNVIVSYKGGCRAAPGFAKSSKKLFYAIRDGPASWSHFTLL